VLQFTPASTNLFSGGLGGPFAPAGLAVLLRNSGNGSLNWNATSDAGWIAANPAGGTLAAGESTTVFVELTALAGTLPTGEHAANIQFANASVSGSLSLIQPVRLQVNSRLEHSSASINNGRFEATLSAPAAGNYAVEWSSDLLTWQTLSSVDAINGTVSFDDAVEAEGQRFYRLRLE
jgi:hypothetical protein